ncbi:hypothetical protein ACPA5B_24610 [Pseudomonas solani]|uniref:hypothetical protein n=1 Tax=Pseudomonas solani TaxID=2731552 RepID=UPI003C301655
MPVKHDLSQDIGIDARELEQRKRDDRKLVRLIDDYESADLKLVELGSNAGLGVSDEDMHKLKAERLMAKDRIVQRLKYGT